MINSPGLEPTQTVQPRWSDSVAGHWLVLTNLRFYEPVFKEIRAFHNSRQVIPAQV